MSWVLDDNVFKTDEKKNQLKPVLFKCKVSFLTLLLKQLVVAQTLF